MSDQLAPVGIDTNILIYAEKSESQLRSISIRAERDQARIFSTYSLRLLARLRDEGHPLLLSSVSLGEYLVPVKPALHAEVIREVAKLFTIVDYNQRAASLAARIVAETPRTGRTMRENGGRPVVMADTKLIASLIAGGARTIYFNDRRAKNIAMPFTDARMLPTTPTDLLEIVEDRDAEESNGPS